MRLKITLFMIVLILCSIKTFSQDLIIKKDSSKISCVIISADDFQIDYKVLKDGRFSFQTIQSKDVLSYYFGNEDKISEVSGGRKKRNKSDRKEIAIFRLNGGLSQPIFDFGSKDIYNINSGYSMQGINFGLGATFMVSKNIGLDLSFVHTRNKIHEDAAYSLPEVLTFETKNPYRNNYLAFGLYTQFHLLSSQKLVLNFNAHLGVNNSRTSKLKYTSPYSSFGLIENDVREGKKYSMAYDFGLGIAYKITRTLSVQLNSTYFASDVFYKRDALTSVSNEVGSTSIVRTVVYELVEFKLLNVNIGVAYTINKNK